MRRPKSSQAMGYYFLILVIAALTSTGCVGLAESIATHLVSQDLKKVQQDFQIFEADLKLFRQCLKERGGSCEGATTTPLPDSSQHLSAQPVTPVDPGGSTLLADSVASLPSDSPAKGAYAVLSHPVVQQAASLHNHLRGHNTEPKAGVSVQTAQGADGAAGSTVTMDMKVRQTRHFHTSLLSSIATTGWEALVGRCDALLEKHKGEADYKRLERDCRRAAFIRGYLEAYLRNGQFLEVDVQLAGAIQAIDQGASTIEGDLQKLRDDIGEIESKIGSAESTALASLSSRSGSVGTQVTQLIERVEQPIADKFGSAGSTITRALSDLATQAGSLAQQLADQADSKITTAIQTLLTDLYGILGQIDTQLSALQSEVANVDRDLVDDIHQGLSQADKTLSNIFRVTNVGFVSRDNTFKARLPTLDATLDPTAKRLVTIKDQDAGDEVLTSKTDFANLGVATDTSGVGTGSSIGAELVRVFLEALFDAQEGLPAVAPAGQPTLKATGLSLGTYSLPLFQSPTGNVDIQDFNQMTRLNDRVATQTRVIVGRIISGIGPFNLNNQPLEDLITEVITTSVRKAAEKASWCWYACDLDIVTQQLEIDAKKGLKDTEKAVEDKVKAEEDKDKTWAAKEAQSIKLRLKLSR